MCRVNVTILIGFVLLIACKQGGNDEKTIVKDPEPLSIVWSKDVPAKHDIINGAAVTFNDEIYVLAGMEGRLMKYNPTTYQWVDLAGMPTPRTEAGVTLWNDKLVVAGGVDDSAKILSRVDYFDLTNQVWKIMTPLPSPRARLSLTVYNNRIYANGGVCGEVEQFNTNCEEILYYNDDSRNWNLQNKLKMGRSGHASVTIGDGMYMIGGYGADPKAGTVYLNHAKREFGFMNELPTPRGNFGAIPVGDFIVTFGGRARSSFSPAEKFNTKTQKWDVMNDCGFWTDRFAYTRWKDRIYVFGGSQAPTQVWKGDIVFAKQ